MITNTQKQFNNYNNNMKNKIVIRPIVKDDITSAVKCIHQASIANKRDYPDTFIDMLNKTHYNEEWLSRKIKTNDFFVATFGKIIVGTGSISGNEVVNVFVDVNFQKCGIGTAMMEYLEKYLRESGYNKAKLNCNLTSLPFYKRLGYRLVKEKVEMWEGHEIKVFEMEKSLQL